jgi:hypothetical protein
MIPSMTKSLTPPTKSEIAKVMSHLGAMKTRKKARSSRENGKMGGRPKKPVANPSR